MKNDTIDHDLPDIELKIKSHSQKRGALVALKGLDVEIQRDDISYEAYINCHEKMVVLLAQIEIFDRSCKLKQV